MRMCFQRNYTVIRVEHEHETELFNKGVITKCIISHFSALIYSQMLSNLQPIIVKHNVHKLIIHKPLYFPAFLLNNHIHSDGGKS